YWFIDACRERLEPKQDLAHKAKVALHGTAPERCVGVRSLIAGNGISYSSAGSRTTCSSTSRHNCLVTTPVCEHVCFVFLKSAQSFSLCDFLVFDRKRQRVCVLHECGAR